MPKHKTMTYVKLAVAIAAALYAVAFVLLNAQYRASVWLFPFVKVSNMPTLGLIIVTAALTMILWWILPQLTAVLKKKRR